MASRFPYQPRPVRQSTQSWVFYPGSWHNITVSAVNYLGGGEESPFALFQTEKDVPGKPQPPFCSYSTILI